MGALAWPKDQKKMSSPSLSRASILEAHELIRPYIHLTPVLTSTTISEIASSPQSLEALRGTRFEGKAPAKPKIRLFFKCENFQKVGAFKARGAFHALLRLTDEELSKGVVTHSSGRLVCLIWLKRKSLKRSLSSMSQDVGRAKSSFLIYESIIVNSRCQLNWI